MSSSILVRRATIGDADAIASLGAALNQQHGDPTEFFTAAAIRRDGFGEAPKFEAWIAEAEGRTIGYALVVPAAYETPYAKAGVYIEDLIVAPEARRKGAGRALVAAVAADARGRGFEFVWWTSRAWNTDAHSFFRTFATAEQPVIAFAVFGDDFDRLANGEGETIPR